MSMIINPYRFGGVAPIGGNDAFTVSLLHLNGVDASTTFTDTNAGGSAHTWTAGGNAQIDTAQSKFGGGSLLCDGSGDYIFSVDSADWDFAGGEFTIDAWVRFNVLPTGTVGSGNGAMIASQWITTSRSWAFAVGFNGVNYNLSFIFVNTTVTGSAVALSTNTWYHVAVVRDNTGTDTLRFFLDGVAAGTDTSINGVTITNSTSAAVVGADAGGTHTFLNGWLDELRISKGVARWTAGFTPPTGEYTA
jgi:hypothetical protein